jgi:nitrate/TMAO reductase-like tetraheme cytochrome c subunit
MLASAGSHILRAAESDADEATYLCLQCHDFDSDGAGHHPSNVPMGRMSSSLIGNQDPTLTCGDCHAAGGGAHNWAGAGVGLDPQWVPAGNGRGTRAVELNTASLSESCEDCHFGEDAMLTPLGPTNNSDDDGSLVTHTWGVDSPAYQDIGEGSHYLGATSMAYNSTGALDLLGSDNWSGGGWSRFSDATGGVSCESCHDLEADKNVAGTALLLEYHADGSAADPSALCEGCHGSSPGGGTPHPMTGDIVSRTGIALSTTTMAYTRSPADVLLDSRATYPVADAMNCDSCHQAHDADTNGGTYIYDSGEGMTGLAGGAAAHDVTGTIVDGADGRIPYQNFRPSSGVTDLSDENFCDSCHNYLQ